MERRHRLPPRAGIVGNSDESFTRIRTGLLPAFAVFDAKGKEGNTDLGVHFGFAPQIQCGIGAGSTSVNGQGTTASVPRSTCARYTSRWAVPGVRS